MEPYYSSVPEIRPARPPPPVSHHSKHPKPVEKSQFHFRIILMIYSNALFAIFCSMFVPIVAISYNSAPFPQFIVPVVPILLAIVVNGLLFSGAATRNLRVLKISRNCTFVLMILLSLFVLLLINVTIWFLVLKDRKDTKLFMDDYHPTHSQKSLQEVFVAMWTCSYLAAIDLFFRSYLINKTIKVIREEESKRITV